MAPFKNNSFGGAQSIKVNEIEFTPTTSDNTSGLSVTASGQKVYVPGNGYVYHVFVGPGTFIVNRSGNVDILLVGGGAGGGKGSPTSYRGGAGEFCSRSAWARLFCSWLARDTASRSVAR